VIILPYFSVVFLSRKWENWGKKTDSLGHQNLPGKAAVEVYNWPGKEGLGKTGASSPRLSFVALCTD